MSRPKKIKDLKQIDGKVHVEEQIAPKSVKKITAHTLDELFGDSGLSKYHTLDVEEYKTQLNEMNGADMRIHASKLGIMPIENIERLKGRLVTAFVTHVAQFNRPDPIGLTRKPSKAVMDVLAEAK